MCQTVSEAKAKEMQREAEDYGSSPMLAIFRRLGILEGHLTSLADIWSKQQEESRRVYEKVNQAEARISDVEAKVSVIDERVSAANIENMEKKIQDNHDMSIRVALIGSLALLVAGPALAWAAAHLPNRLTDSEHKLLKEQVHRLLDERARRGEEGLGFATDSANGKRNRNGASLDPYLGGR